jgi:hypothetical protein
MFFKDHTPPHFHASYGEHEALISISDGEVVEGELPKQQLRLVQAWFELHREELMFNYVESQKANGLISKIEPLK